ncbi:MAG TPA: hypothetical protein VF759_04715 [Allosphingosinicella sp.]|jgi:hypothetical protein
MAGLLLLGLAACGPAAEDSGRNDSAAAENGSGAAPAAAAPAPAPAEAALAPLQLEGHGLRISGAAPGTELPFNTPKAATIDALTKALGRPPTELGENEECGGGALEFAAWEGQITAWFESGRFAGWDNKGKLKTPQGIGIGSSRSEIARLRGLEVEDSTLGTEFRAGGLSGILDSKGPDAKVTDLWGGSTCVFR